MATFQRSEVSFRRRGSSGLVWQDAFISGDLNQMRREQMKKATNSRELRHSQSDGSVGMMQNRQSNGGIILRTSKVLPDIDPPSPKVSGCWFCCPGE